MTKYIEIYFKRRMLTTLLLGFSSGIPLALTASGGTIQAWLTMEKIDVSTIGYFGLVGLPYATKFLWAPFLDSIMPLALGLRRGWLLITQIGLFASTIVLAQQNPSERMDLFALWAFFVAFFSASQDIVVDAYRAEIIEDRAEVGAGAGAYVAGYRIATVVSGGVALGMSKAMSWQTVYFYMALINLVGVITTIFSPEPRIEREQRKFNFNEMVVTPFADYFKRNGAMEVLLFIMVYKLSTLMATNLTTKYLMDLAFERDAIGYVQKGFGLVATIGGTMLGGSLMLKIGLKRALWIFGFVQSLVGLTFWVLPKAMSAYPGYNLEWMIAIICVDNFMMGMGTAALTGFMMSFANKAFTGVQYALLTSVMAVSRVILVAQSGSLVNYLGWDHFFILTVPLGLPGLFLLLQFESWQTEASELRENLSPGLKLNIFVFLSSLLLLASPPVFNYLELKEVGHQAETVGALGILIVVLVGVFKPILKFSRGLEKNLITR